MSLYFLAAVLAIWGIWAWLALAKSRGGVWTGTYQLTVDAVDAIRQDVERANSSVLVVCGSCRLDPHPDMRPQEARRLQQSVAALVHAIRRAYFERSVLFQIAIEDGEIPEALKGMDDVKIEFIKPSGKLPFYGRVIDRSRVVLVDREGATAKRTRYSRGLAPDLADELTDATFAA